MNDQQQNWIRPPVEVPAEVRYAHSLGRGFLLRRQIEELVKAINPEFVETKQRMTYLAQHQARAEMNRIFGYGNWDVTAGEPTLLYEYQGPGTTEKTQNNLYWFVGYRIATTVEIRDLWGMPVATYTGVHAEENAPQPNRGEAHALALTSVDSYALRRALINLGDRFGLGLYDKGSQALHGKYTIQLENGVLYDPWVQVGGQQPQQEAVAVPQQPQQGLATSPQMEGFHQAQAQVQEGRDQARSAMQERLQQGLNTDG